MRRNIRPFSVSLIGAGRVGTTVTALLRQRGHRVVSVITRNPASARPFARFVNCPLVSKSISDVSAKSDVLVLAVPDEEISGVAFSIVKAGISHPDQLTAFHVSGVVTSEALSPLSENGTRTFSLHPIQTFPPDTPLKKQMQAMKGIWYGFEGEAQSRPFARSLVGDLGGKFLTVPKEEKMLYHVACVFASNYPVAVLGAVETLAKHLQFKDISPFKPLVTTAIREALSRGSAETLTGPVARGSARIVQSHLNELVRKRKDMARLYSALGLFALRLAAQAGKLTKDQVLELESILSEIS